jgi:hypothetical protein
MELRAEIDPASAWNRTVKPMAGGVDRFVTSKSELGKDPNAAIGASDEQQEASGAYHSVLVEERVWTANWINQYEYHRYNLSVIHDQDEHV